MLKLQATVHWDGERCIPPLLLFRFWVVASTLLATSNAPAADRGHYLLEAGQDSSVCIAYNKAIVAVGVPAPIPCGPANQTTSEAIQWVRWDSFFDTPLLEMAESRKHELARRLDYFYWRLSRNNKPETLKPASTAQLAEKDFLSYRSNYWESMDALQRRRSITQVPLHNKAKMETLYRNDSCEAGPIGNDIVVLNGSLSDVDFHKTSAMLASIHALRDSEQKTSPQSTAESWGETQFDIFLFDGRYYIQEWHWPEADLSATIRILDLSSDNSTVCRVRWIPPPSLLWHK